ncbi:MAG: PAS domain S-box protein [Acidobacteriaceae bacterium]|nr:PAS domain S-box protein [Acidobacteriaceae bacterium]
MLANSADALQAFQSGNQISDRFFRETVDALPVAIYMTDAQGLLTYCNSAAVKLFGRTPEIGSDQWSIAWKIFQPDGTPLPHNQCPLGIALKGGEIASGAECVAERPDGTFFWFIAHPTILRDPQGRILGGINLLTDITERKNAELEAKEQFRAIVETTQECVSTIAPDGTLLFINGAGLAMLGASSVQSIPGGSIYNLVAPEDRPRFRAFHKAVCGGEKGSLQYDIIALNGERLHAESYSAPLRSRGGAAVHLSVTHDVTERKRAERAALLLSAIVASSDDAIVSKDLEGVVTSWNKSAEHLFGYTAAEAIGRTIASLIIPSDRQEEEPSILARLRKGERIDHFDTMRQRKDGSLVEVSLTVSPVKDSRGVIVGASKIARDITETKRIQKALRESEARFRQLADTMPQIVWTARPDGVFDYYNERWFEFTGFSRAPVENANWERILHPTDLQPTLDAWNAAIASGKPLNIEYRLLDPRGKHWVWFVGRAVPVLSPSGSIEKWFGTATNIDDQKLAQDELRSANEDLEQFAFSASHDLQEPLRTIKIYGEILFRRYADRLDGDALKFMRFMHNSANRMETLVRDLLTYTQVTRLEQPVQVTDANRALRTSLENLSGAICESGARITTGPLPSLSINVTHLHQLFQNLIGNAIKYRNPEQSPAIHITAERRDQSWIFSVADNGIGIDPEYKENIFGLFKRLHNSNEYSGTGIGLAICRRIVDRYHGRVWVESEPGRGSTFFFSLPV